MSELSDRVDGITKIRLRQSREIARLIDAHGEHLRKRNADGGEVTQTDKDRGIDFLVGVIAQGLDMPPTEVAELEASVLELQTLFDRVLARAGFVPGEVRPAPSSSIGDSSGSTTASPPAMDTTSPQSAK